MSSSVRRLLLVSSLVVFAHRSLAAQEAPRLGTAASFAILGGSAVTSSHRSRIIGNVGVSPGSTITGIAPEDVSIGRIYRNDAVAREAQKDAKAAYADPESSRCEMLEVFDETPLPGKVYCFNGDARLTKTLTLTGDRDAIWIFKVRGALIANAQSSVVVIGGGSDAHVFWQVGEAATIAEGSSFRGTILARTDITLKAGASLSGRALALTGRVTLDGNDVSLCCEPIDITPETLPGGTVGTQYRQTIAAHGGSGSYTFSIVDKPPWLNLGGDGVLSGMPEAGSFTFTVIATDNVTHCSGRRTYTVNVCPTHILPDTLPIGFAGEMYNVTFVPPFGDYGVTPPPGWPLEFHGETPNGPKNVLRGIPSTEGPYTFIVTARDPVTGCTDSRTYTVDVICHLTIDNDQLPSGKVNEEYSVKLKATGGSRDYTFDSDPQSTFSFHGTDMLTGTPQTAGPSKITVTVTDTKTGCMAHRTYPIQIEPPCVITIHPESLPEGIVGTMYPGTIKPQGGTGRYTVMASESRPPGLTPELTGVPTTPGTYCFTVTVTDDKGCTAMRDYCVEVHCPTIVFSPLTLPDAEVGIPYDHTLTPSGGTPLYTFMVVFSPPGDFNASPAIGIFEHIFATPPTVAGVVHLTITATDSYGCSGSQDYSIRVHTAKTSTDVPALSPAALLFLVLLLAAAAILALWRLQ